MIPIKIGTPEQFAAVRNYLRESGFSESAICERLGIEKTSDITSTANKPVDDLLTRLFFLGVPIAAAEWQQAVPAPVRDACDALGLVQQKDDSFLSTVALYQTYGLYIASDRYRDPDGSPAGNEDDFVYLAITENSQHFAELIPRDPCDEMLDVGTGCGLAALSQAGVAAKVCGVDIASRSVEFARFNQHLNGIHNAEFFEGNVYDPIGRRTFDRIAAHPPYDPSFRNRWVFSDGGDDGEQVTRRIVEALPVHLRPGGEFYCLTTGSDRAGEPFEQRIRKWLGAASGEFDVAIIVRAENPPEEFAYQAALAASGKLADLPKFLEIYKRLNVTAVVYSSILLRRKTESRPPITIRRLMGDNCTSGHLRWLLGWELRRPHFDWSTALPVASPAMALYVRHHMQDGELVPVQYRLVSADPIRVEVDCPAWTAFLISKCDGSHTGHDLYELVRARGNLSEKSFSEAVTSLISAGILTA